MDKTLRAELRGEDTDNLTLIVFDTALKKGGINKGYGSSLLFDVPAVRCDNIGERVSWRMDTLGATLLHEYTHWHALMNPPLDEGTQDFFRDRDGFSGYGAVNTRDIDRYDALLNADSYDWCATEMLWTTICGKDFEDPKRNDADDPACDLSWCIRW